MDQTAELNELIATAPPFRVVDLEGQTFTCDWPVTIPAGVEVRNATIIRPTDGSGLTPPPGAKPSWRQTLYHVVVEGRASNIHVQGPGAIYNPDTEQQHGFKLDDGATIEDCTVTNVLGDGISFNESPGCTARGVTVDGCGRQGMSWVHGTDGLLEDCTFTRVARTAIDLEPMAALDHVITGFVARRTTVGTYGNRVFGAGGSGEVHDVLIDGLTMVDGWLSMDVPHRDSGSARSDFTFRNCVGTHAKDRPAFTFDQVDGILIDGCSQSFTGKVRPPAVRAIACTDVVLTGCTWPGASTPLATS